MPAMKKTKAKAKAKSINAAPWKAEALPFPMGKEAQDLGFVADDEKEGVSDEKPKKKYMKAKPKGKTKPSTKSSTSTIGKEGAESGRNFANKQVSAEGPKEEKKVKKGISILA